MAGEFQPGLMSAFLSAVARQYHDELAGELHASTPPPLLASDPQETVGLTTIRSLLSE